MSPDSQPRRGKRRRTDTNRTTPVDPEAATQVGPESQNDSLEEASPLPRPAPPPKPVPRPIAAVRAPEAPFHPGATELWVFRDEQGKKQLTSEMVPGSRHWRIGDPHVPFCFECKKEGGLLGCHTCKRSYHLACLGDIAETPPKQTFYCPLCIERGWNVRPPPEILPLSPVSSREVSPAPVSRPSHTAQSVEPSTGLPHTTTASVAAIKDPRELTSSVRGRADGINKITFAAVNNSTPSLPLSQRVESGIGPAPPQTGEARASAFMRVYDLQPPVATSSPQAAGQIERARLGRPKSRYQTMPDEVDQALTVIYRELEGVTALRQDVVALQDQLKTTEQARRILENQLALELSGHASVAQKDAEIDSLKRQILELRSAHELLQQENRKLKERAETDEHANQTGLEEVRAMKASLRRLLGE